MYHHLTLSLPGILDYQHEVKLEVVPFVTGQADTYTSEAEQAMRLAAAFASLAAAGIKVECYTTEYKQEDSEVVSLRDEVVSLRRKVVDQAETVAHYQHRLSVAETELLNLKLGPAEGRPAKALAYMRETCAMNHPDHGKKVEQIKKVRAMLGLSLKEAKDYVEQFDCWGGRVAIREDGQPTVKQAIPSWY